MFYSTQPIHRRSKAEGGFTLIELLVVIIILGILASVVVFAVGGVGDKGQDAADSIDARTLRTAEEAFLANNGRYGTEDELVQAGLLSEPSRTHNIDLGSEGNGSLPPGTPNSSYVIYVPQTDIDLLRVAAPVDTGVISPAKPANITMSSDHSSVIETLALAGPDLTTLPLLATSWSFAAPATWTIQIRPGVTFHNGAPLDAAAVVATLNGRLAATFVRGLTTTASSVAGPMTVQVVTSPANSQLIQQLAHPSTGIVAPGTYPGRGTGAVDPLTGATDTPTGTGPYRFVSYTPLTEVRVARNASYWAGPPTFSEMVTLYMPDGASRVQGLRAGEVDGIYDVPRPQVAALSSDRKFTVEKSVTGAHQSLYLNAEGNAPYNTLNDLQLRKAVAHAIDASGIVQNVWPGGAEPMKSLIPASILGEANAATVTGFAYDPPMARQILDAAGWIPGPDGVRVKAGNRLELLMQVRLPDEQQPLPELVKAQLAEVGIALTINIPPNPSAFFAKLAVGEGHLFSTGSASGVEHPLGPGTFFRTGASGPGLYMSPGATYDALHDSAYTAVDTPTFQGIVTEMMDILVDQQAIVVPIAGVFRIYGVSRSLEGFVPYTFIQSQRWHTLTPRG
ncbi:MAG: ABC transporter substrate-binding protein [Acidimicrobiales bacterium]